MKKVKGVERTVLFVCTIAFVTILAATPAMGTSIDLKAVTSPFLTAATLPVQGQSETLMLQGLLMIGGQDAQGVRKSAYWVNPQTGATTAIGAQLSYARAWHSATVLPDGSVLVLGGVGEGGAIVTMPEQFDPIASVFVSGTSGNLTPRAFHTATLLVDRRVLIVGGISADGSVLGSIELWDPGTGQSTMLPVQLLTPRSGHTATLLPDGSVQIWGGVDGQGQSVSYGEVIDPITATVRMEAVPLQPAQDQQPPQLETSLPQNGAAGVAVNVVLSLRFSKPLSLAGVNTSSVVLAGPNGAIPAKVIPAEGGMLLFVTPLAALESSAVYTLSLNGLTDNQGQAVPYSAIAFTTAAAATGVGTGVTSGSPGDTSSNSSGQQDPAGAAGGALSVAQTDSPSLAQSGKSPTAAPGRSSHFLVTPVPFERARRAIEGTKNRPQAKTMAMMAAASGSTAAAPEIVELARALKYDPDLIYQYVHDNIEFSPLWGALKGPVGTLLDGRGDSFDQASLMVSLLNEASKYNSTISSASYLFGQLSLNLSQLGGWLFCANSAAIPAILAQGGIPASVNLLGNAAFVGHVWVSVSINGTAYVFDPAFKPHNCTSGIVSNLGSIMGYSRAQFIADAHATVTSTTIQGVNRAQLRNDLATYANNLARYIRTNFPDAGMSDIVGGATIKPTQLINGQTVRQPSNPNQSGPPTLWSTIPSGYHGTITIALPGAATQTFNSDDIYGHRLSIFFDASYVPTLYLDGAPVISGSASSNGATVPVTLSMHSPAVCPSSDGKTCDFTSQNPPTFYYWADRNHIHYISAQTNGSGGYVVQTGWDQVGRGMIEKHRKLLNQAIASGNSTNSEVVLGESLAVLGYTYLAELAAQERLSDQLLGTTTEVFYDAGIVGEAGSAITSPYVDLFGFFNEPSRISGGCPQSLIGETCQPPPSWVAAFLDNAGAGSAFESAALEQTQAQISGFVAASTVKLLDIAVQNGDTIFDINNGNTSASQQYYQTTIRSQLVPNYNAVDLSSIDDLVGNQGFRVIAPLHGQITVGAWTGVGYKAMGVSADGSYSAPQYISGPLNGGNGGTSDQAPSLAASTGNSCSAPSVSPVNIIPGVSSPGVGQVGGDPVDLQKGSYIYQHDDLTIGPKGFPYGLAFRRSYDSGAQGIAGALGNGWTHNYAIAAKIDSDGFTGMGQGSPLSAASSIAALYVSSDLIMGQAMDNGQQNLESFALEAVVNRWFTDQLTQNVVNVTRASNTEQFTKMADGSYAAPLASAAILDVNGGTFRYRTKTGATIAFNSSGQISSWTNAAGASASFSYAGGQLSSVTSATGRQFTFGYSGNQVTSVSDGSRTVSYSYTSGNLTSFTDALSQKTAFAYDTSGSYDTAGHLTQVFYPSNPNNAFVTNYYDSLGRVKQQYDARGNPTQVLIAGVRTEMIDPLNISHVWYNDSNGHVITEIQDYGLSTHLNLTTQNSYDGQGNLISTQMPCGNVTTFTYDSYFNLLTIIDWPADPTKCPSNSGQSIRIHAFTYVAPVAVLPNFEVVNTATDPNRNVTSYGYDNNGNVKEIDQPAVAKPGISGSIQPAQRFTYTNIGLLQTATDAEGRVTTYNYDPAFADQVSSITVVNLVTQYGYNAYGDVNSVTDANQNTSTTQFDPLRRKTEVDGPIPGVVTRYTYFPNGPVQTVARKVTANPDTWETTQYTYTLTDKVAVVTDPLGSTTTTAYDAADRIQTVTQQVTAVQNRQRTYSYDSVGRRYQVADTSAGTPGTVLETHTYTPNGKEQRFTDANNHIITYVYDGLDRLDHAAYPDQTIESYQYDSTGNVLLKITRSGQTIGFSYDALNRVLTKTPQGGMGPITYGYDLTGRLLQAGDQSSSNPYLVGYDAVGRANSYTDQQGRSTQVEYDGVGNRTKITWPANTNGPVAYYVTYQYDALNRMTDIYENGSSSNRLAHYDWDLLSRQTRITYGDGTTDAYSQYDAGDNLQTLTQTLGGGSSVTFSYSWYQNHQRQSTAVDNAIFQYVPNPGTATSYAAADVDNGYTSSTSSPAGEAPIYTYDASHNLTFDGSNTLTYDVENRLVQALNAGWGMTDYLYDPLGHRKQKQVGGVISQFVLAGEDEIADYNCFQGTCTPWTLTVRGVGGLPVASITPAGGNQVEYVAYYHHDVMGSTVAATTPGTTGAAEVYSYSEFGMPSGGGTLAYTFAGYRYDQETGLYYVRARYYSATLGRFLQPDPIGVKGGRNLYAYVGNDPINLTDPSGFCQTSNFASQAWQVFKDAGSKVDNYITTASNWLNEHPAVALLPAVAELVVTKNPGPLEESVNGIGAELEGAVTSLGNTIATSGTTIARQLGQAGELAVGMDGPKLGIQIPGSGITRFPDGLTSSTISEVKNVQYLSFTQQLRDYLSYAVQNNLQFNLYVRPSTTLSGPLQDAVSSGDINLLFIP
jgi:RHS repeat-associated protein